MIYRSQKFSLLDWIALVGFTSYYILPSVSARVGILQIVLISIVYILISTQFKVSIEALRYFAIFVIIGILYALLVDATDISNTTSNLFFKKFYSKFYQLFMMFFPLFLLKIVRLKATNHKKNILILMGFLLILYVEITTRTALEINANVTRSWGNYSDELRKLNIGHYGFVYSIPIVIALLSITFFKSRPVIVKSTTAVLIITQMSFLLIAQYTLAVFAAIVGMLFFLMIHYSGSKKIIILSIVIIGLLPLVPSLIKLAADTVPSESMSIRLYEVYFFFMWGDGSGYNLSGRIELYEKSIIAFFRSPIWGNRSLNFYGHATFLVIPAMLGLMGAIPFYYVYFHSYKKIKESLGDKGRQFIPIFAILLFVGFTNPIEAALPLMFVTWFLAPLVIEQLCSSDNHAETRLKNETVEN